MSVSSIRGASIQVPIPDDLSFPEQIVGEIIPGSIPELSSSPRDHLIRNLVNPFDPDKQGSLSKELEQDKSDRAGDEELARFQAFLDSLAPVSSPPVLQLPQSEQIKDLRLQAASWPLEGCGVALNDLEAFYTGTAKMGKPVPVTLLKKLSKCRFTLRRLQAFIDSDFCPEKGRKAFQAQVTSMEARLLKAVENIWVYERASKLQQFGEKIARSFEKGKIPEVSSYINAMVLTAEPLYKFIQDKATKDSIHNLESLRDSIYAHVAIPGQLLGQHCRALFEKSLESCTEMAQAALNSQQDDKRNPLLRRKDLRRAQKPIEHIMTEIQSSLEIVPEVGKAAMVQQLAAVTAKAAQMYLQLESIYATSIFKQVQFLQKQDSSRQVGQSLLRFTDTQEKARTRLKRKAEKFKEIGVLLPQIPPEHDPMLKYGFVKRRLEKMEQTKGEALELASIRKERKARLEAER